MTVVSELPVLYSFRRCPYAIRARLAIIVSNVSVSLREVVLRDKPEDMLTASPKGTVPVLVLSSGAVIEESLEIMQWALQQQDPLQLLRDDAVVSGLIAQCDGPFKQWLDRYKYADRHPEQSREEYRERACGFVETLEYHLSQSRFLGGERPVLSDVAIVPFIRQFAGVEPQWWADAPYPQTRRWLDGWLNERPFALAMGKYKRWQPGDPETVFPPAD